MSSQLGTAEILSRATSSFSKIISDYTTAEALVQDFQKIKGLPRLDYGSTNDHAQHGSIIQHIGAANGYVQGGKNNHGVGCAVVEGTLPPHYSMPKEAGLRVVDYVSPVHNNASVGARLAAGGHIANETRDSADVALDELMDRIRKDKTRCLAVQADIRSLASKLTKGYPSSDDEETPGDSYGSKVTHLPLTKLDDNATEEQTGNGNNHSGVPKERDDADDDAEKQEGDTKRVPIVDINAIKELVTTTNKQVGATGPRLPQSRPLLPSPRS